MIETTKTEVYGEGTKTELMEQLATTADLSKTEMAVHPVPQVSERIVPLKHLRLACLALAVIGIPLLYMAALFSRPQPVKVGQIGGSMQSALVAVQGTLVREPRLIKQAAGVGEITLFVDDGSGVIAVRAYKGVARDILLQDKLPRMGDVVAVSGTVQVDSLGDFNLLLVKAADLNILPQELPRKTLLQVQQESFRGAIQSRITVEKVQAPGAHGNRPWRFVVSDGSASLEMIVWKGMLEPSLPLAWGPGAVLEGRLAVSSFRGQTQLSISRLEDLVLKQAGAEIRPLVAPDQEATGGR